MSAQEKDNTPGPAPVHDITEPRRDERLRDEFALVRERRPVYVLDTKEAAKRKGSAERMDRMRKRKAEAGLTTMTNVPATLADQVKTAGGWEQWLQARQQAAQPPAPAPTPAPEATKGPEVPAAILEAVQAAGGWEQWLQTLQAAAAPKPSPQVPKPPQEGPKQPPPRRQLNNEEKRAMELGFRVLRGSGPRGWLVRLLLGS